MVDDRPLEQVGTAGRAGRDGSVRHEHSGGQDHAEHGTHDHREQCAELPGPEPDEDLGPLKMQNLMFRLQRTPGAIRHGGRRIGQDTEQVLTELLGMTGDEVKALRSDGVL